MGKGLDRHSNIHGLKRNLMNKVGSRDEFSLTSSVQVVTNGLKAYFRVERDDIMAPCTLIKKDLATNFISFIVI